MAAPKRTALEIERDRAEISSLYIRGWFQTAIATKLGLSQSQISYDLKAIQERWHADTARDLDADKAKELSKLDALEREYWQAWERSQLNKGIAETTKTAASGSASAQERELTRSEGQVGNPAFLEGVLKCIDRRCKLLGLDSEVGSPERPMTIQEVPPDELDLSNLTDEQLDAVAAIAEANNIFLEGEGAA